MADILSQIISYLPQHQGILPQWLLFTSVVSLGNTIQCYLTTAYSSQVYLGPASKPGSAYPSTSPVTPLSSRTFGTWCVIQAVVRLYAAYFVSNPQIYQMAIMTYGVAWAHFMSEWLIFGTARMGRGLLGPVLVANSTLVWMLLQWGFYVK